MAKEKKILLTKKGKEVQRPHLLNNKFAVGNKGGRPPHFTDEELIELGREMIEQVRNNPDWIFIQEFAIYKQMSPLVLFELGRKAVFAEYYDYARSILGVRIVKNAGKQNEKGQLQGLHPSIAQRFLNTYFRDVKDTEMEMKKEDVKNAQKAISILYKGTMDVSSDA